MTSCEGRASKPKRINGCKIEDHQDSFSSTMKCKSLQIYFLQSALKHRWPFINFDFDTPTTFYRLFWAVNPVPLSLFFVWDEGKKIPVNETVMCVHNGVIFIFIFFQQITGKEDIEECTKLLEKHNWNMTVKALLKYSLIIFLYSKNHFNTNQIHYYFLKSIKVTNKKWAYFV